MPAAILRIGTKIVTGAISAWKKTKTARSVFSTTKDVFQSWSQRKKAEYEQQKRIEPTFPVWLAVAISLSVVFILSILFPGLAPVSFIAAL